MTRGSSSQRATVAPDVAAGASNSCQPSPAWQRPKTATWAPPPPPQSSRPSLPIPWRPRRQLLADSAAKAAESQAASRADKPAAAGAKQRQQRKRQPNQDGDPEDADEGGGSYDVAAGPAIGPAAGPAAGPAIGPAMPPSAAAAAQAGPAAPPQQAVKRQKVALSFADEDEEEEG